jgi:antitoxin HigA-1
MSANALAKALHVPAPRVNDIVRERSGVTADTALLHTCSVFEVELAAE